MLCLIEQVICCWYTYTFHSKNFYRRTNPFCSFHLRKANSKLIYISKGWLKFPKDIWHFSHTLAHSFTRTCAPFSISSCIASPSKWFPFTKRLVSIGRKSRQKSFVEMLFDEQEINIFTSRTFFVCVKISNGTIVISSKQTLGCSFFSGWIDLIFMNVWLHVLRTLDAQYNVACKLNYT